MHAPSICIFGIRITDNTMVKTTPTADLIIRMLRWRVADRKLPSTLLNAIDKILD